MYSQRSPCLSKSLRKLNLQVDARFLASAAVGFLFAAGTWMSRPLGINAMDVVLIPTAIVVSVRLIRSGEMPKWVAFIALSLAVGVLWPPVLLLTATTSARVVGLGVVGYWIWRNGALWPLSVGLLAGFALQALPLPAVMFESRTPGIAPTISLLGMVGFIAYSSFSIQGRSVPWFFTAIGVVTIAASGARAPLVASLVIEGLRGRRLRYFVLLIGVFVITAYCQGALHRITTAETLRQAVEVRLASAQINVGMDERTYELRYEYLNSVADGKDVLIDDRAPRPIIERLRGVGISSYHAVIGWPRPHNIFTLAWREMGVFIALPIAVLIFAVRRKVIGPGLIAGLLVYGLVDDSLLSANGHYGLASIILVEAKVRNRTHAN